MSLTPHGPGFSFIDSFEILEAGRRGRSVKWLDPASPWFADHFPGKPLMPGVLLIECAAQAAGALWQSGQEMRPLFLAQAQQFRWMKTVLPGETVTVEVILEKAFGTLALFEVTIRVGEDVVASGKITMSQSTTIGGISFSFLGP